LPASSGAPAISCSHLLLGIVLAAFATQFVVDGVKGAFHWTE
jgi:small neutral amino acid transporter SnatA (MarC family)